MRRAVVEQRRADFDIPASLLRVCSHIRGADEGRLLRTQMVWSAWFRSGRGNLGVGPIYRSGFWSCSATAYVWTHVMICIEGNFLPASAPRMCEHTFTEFFFLTQSSEQWTWNEILLYLRSSYRILLMASQYWLIIHINGKTAVTPLLIHWSYCSFELSHWYVKLGPQWLR